MSKQLDVLRAPVLDWLVTSARRLPKPTN